MHIINVKLEENKYIQKNGFKKSMNTNFAKAFDPFGWSKQQFHFSFQSIALITPDDGSQAVSNGKK